MELVFPYDPFELHLIYQTRPGMSWYVKQRVFNDLRDMIVRSLGESNSCYQQGLHIHFSFFMDPQARWLSPSQSRKVRCMSFSSLLIISEHILNKTLYESNYYVRDISAEKKYDTNPRIEMRYDLYEARNFEKESRAGAKKKRRI